MCYLQKATLFICLEDSQRYQYSTLLFIQTYVKHFFELYDKLFKLTKKLLHKMTQYINQKTVNESQLYMYVCVYASEQIRERESILVSFYILLYSYCCCTQILTAPVVIITALYIYSSY